MYLEKISTGKNPPHEFNVIIEIPMGGVPVKYEIDKESSAIMVDRFLPTAMFYPCNYGFINHTLSDDGDPIDVLVISEFPVIPGSILPARPIGILIMEDESGQDEKILAVPTQKLTTYYDNINSYQDLPQITIQRINHFFEYYKKLEVGKWVKVAGWQDVEVAKKLITEAISRYKPIK
ncbi:MAG: inorganic diphosphatase [Rickettsiales endosymbiont of Dermacentor nuttalli]